MNSEREGRSRSGLPAAAGVVVMLVVLMIVLGGGFLLTRQLLQAGIPTVTPEASSPDRVGGRSDQPAPATVAPPGALGGPTTSSESRAAPGVEPTRITMRDGQQPAAAESSTSGLANPPATSARGTVPRPAVASGLNESSSPAMSDPSTSLLDHG